MTDTTDDFRRARGALLARLRREGRLSPIARLVGWEIAMLLNPEQGGYAWPSHEYLKDQLHIGDRSVKLRSPTWRNTSISRSSGARRARDTRIITERQT
jgi:hypothetical protein